MLPIIIFIIAISLITFLLIRNFHTHKQQLKWNDIVYNYRGILIDNKDFNKLNEYSYIECIYAVKPYRKMLFSFRWKLEAFVVNQQLFNEIMSTVK